MSVSRLYDDPDEPSVLRLPSGSYIRPIRADQADSVYDDLVTEHHHHGDEDDGDEATVSGDAGSDVPVDRLTRTIQRAFVDWDRRHPEAAAERAARDRAERARLAAMTPRQRRRRQRWLVYMVCPEARPWWWTPGYYAYRAWYRATSWLPARWRFHTAWWLTIILLAYGTYRLVT
jgi:hypothetical protein